MSISMKTNRFRFINDPYYKLAVIKIVISILIFVTLPNLVQFVKNDEFLSWYYSFNNIWDTINSLWHLLCCFIYKNNKIHEVSKFQNL